MMDISSVHIIYYYYRVLNLKNLIVHIYVTLNYASYETISSPLSYL